MLSTSTPEVNNPVADACEAAGVPCLSTVQPWESWYFGRGAKPGGKNPFKWTYHFSFGDGPVRGGVPRDVAARPEQQEGRSHVAERRRRQRHPGRAWAAAREGRLHDRRPGRLRGRHDRLLEPDREVQAGELPDLQHVPDPAGLHHLLAAGGAAGLHADGADLPDREDGPLPVAGRGVGLARLQPRERRLLAPDLPVQVAARPA